MIGAAAATGVGRCLVAPGFSPPPAAPGPQLDYAELFYGDGERWLRLESDPSYTELLRTEHEPLSEMARQILRSMPPTEASDGYPWGPLDVIALGPGGGRREMALLRQMVDLGADKVRLFLIDLTDAQVTAAHEHALQVLSPYCRPGVQVTAFVGNMFELGAYEGVLRRSPGPYRQKRLVVALGATLGNLDELHFIGQVLSPFCTPGDLLLFDCALCPPAQVPDPRLGAAIPPALHDWFSAALKRRGVKLHRVEVKLGPPPKVPGSYAIEFWGHTDRGPHRLARVGRYEPDRLCAAICALGWAKRALLPFAQGSYPQGLFLFQKGENP